MTQRYDRYVKDLLKYAAEHNELDTRVFTAAPLTEDQETRLREALLNSIKPF